MNASFIGMKPSWRQSIASRFTLAIIGLVFFISVALLTLEAFLFYRHEVDRVSKELEQIKLSHLPSLESSLWLTDYTLLQEQINAIARFPYVVRVEVEDDAGQELVAGEADLPGFHLVEERLSHSRRGNEVYIGRLRIYIDQARIHRESARNLSLIAGGNLLIMLALALVLLSLFRSHIAKPLEQLAADLTAQPSAGTLEALHLKRRVDYPDELASLLHAINTMRGNLKTYIEERDLLISEVHHRIKNDMSFIRSLLFLQADQSDSQMVKAAIEEASQRVSVMARIYERLYSDANFNVVAVKPLVQQLVSDLSELTDLMPEAIELEVEDFVVPTKLSMAIGIILNELMTNALKYGFTGDQPHIRVQLQPDSRNGQVILSVADEGPGLPEEVINGQRIGFGLTIVQAMTDQHNGKLVLQNQNGAVALVSLRLGAAA